ncbi:MAG TPA: hypothetical protein VGJ74_17475, partial [Burkholderiales bacterium]
SISCARGCAHPASHSRFLGGISRLTRLAFEGDQEISTGRSLVALAVSARPWVLFGLLLSLPFIWSSEGFQEMAFPRTYWRKKVEELEGTVVLYRRGAESCLLDLQKMLRTLDLDVAQAMRNGMTPEAAREHVRTMYQLQQTLCRSQTELDQQEQSRLNEARAKAQRYAN